MTHFFLVSSSFLFFLFLSIPLSSSCFLNVYHCSIEASAVMMINYEIFFIHEVQLHFVHPQLSMDLIGALGNTRNLWLSYQCTVPHKTQGRSDAALCTSWQVGCHLGPNSKVHPSSIVCISSTIPPSNLQL